MARRFAAARRAALVGDLLRYLQGRPVDLLAFDEVRDRLRLRNLVDRGLVDVPLDRIVGSVGRPHEFNRAFLPRKSALRQRWEEVEELVEGSVGFPPVQLYQVGDVFFVVDGHHRVSVERSIGAPTIEAQVKEFLSPVSLGPDASLEEVILKSGLVGFLETTGLAPEDPEELVVTVADGYERLLDHISVHRYFLGIELEREIPWEEAVASWYRVVYRPVLELIRESSVLDDFPGRTAADLYLFTMDHLHHLRERYGEEAVGPRDAVEDLARQERGYGKAGGRLRSLLGRRERETDVEE